MANQDVRSLLKYLGVSSAQLAAVLGRSGAAVASLVGNSERIPRQPTVESLLRALNAILADRGSDRRVTYDELWAAFCVGRLQVVPVAPPDTAVDLRVIDGGAPTNAEGA